MRVCLFTDADVFAGTERHMLDLAHGLRQAEVDVRVACPHPSVLGRRAAQSGIEVLTIAKRGLVDRAAVRTLAGLLRSGEIDVVHAHNGRTALSAALAVQVAGRGCCVATQHFLTPNHTLQRGLKALPGRLAHRWVKAHTHRVIAISDAVRQEMLARHEAPEDRITIVPNGLACDTRSLASPAQVRAEFDVPSEAPLVVCVARLEPEKDIPTLLAAMQTVLQTHPEAQALVVGDGAARQTLEAQIETLGLAPSVRLVGYREDALAFIQAADIFVLPSLAEPFGLVLIEAMALGRPVIATRAGGPREIVVPGETGLLVPPGDPEALASALSTLLTEPDTRRRLGANGLHRYREHYTVERMTDATVAVYRSALQSLQ